MLPITHWDKPHCIISGEGKAMLRFIAKRILTMLLTLLVIMTLTFLIMHAIPGGPYSAGKRLPEEIQAALDEKYKLNDPLYVQFFDYMNGVLHFDLGPSCSPCSSRWR